MTTLSPDPRSRICRVCGREFQTREARRVCSRCHEARRPSRRRYATQGVRSGKTARMGVHTMEQALAVVEAQLRDATPAEARILEIERDALRWCQAHPTPSMTVTGTARKAVVA